MMAEIGPEGAAFESAPEIGTLSVSMYTLSTDLPNHTVWWRHTALEDAQLIFDGSHSSIDSYLVVVSVYTGPATASSQSDLTLITAGAPGVNPLVTVQEGHTYWVSLTSVDEIASYRLLVSGYGVITDWIQDPAETNVWGYGEDNGPVNDERHNLRHALVNYTIDQYKSLTTPGPDYHADITIQGYYLKSDPGKLADTVTGLAKAKMRVANMQAWNVARGFKWPTLQWDWLNPIDGGGAPLPSDKVTGENAPLVIEAPTNATARNLQRVVGYETHTNQQYFMMPGHYYWGVDGLCDLTSLTDMRSAETWNFRLRQWSDATAGGNQVTIEWEGGLAGRAEFQEFQVLPTTLNGGKWHDGSIYDAGNVQEPAPIEIQWADFSADWRTPLIINNTPPYPVPDSRAVPARWGPCQGLKQWRYSDARGGWFLYDFPPNEEYHGTIGARNINGTQWLGTARGPGANNAQYIDSNGEWSPVLDFQSILDYEAETAANNEYGFVTPGFCAIAFGKAQFADSPPPEWQIAQTPPEGYMQHVSAPGDDFEPFEHGEGKSKAYVGGVTLLMKTTMLPQRYRLSYFPEMPTVPPLETTDPNLAAELKDIGQRFDR